MSSDRKRKFLVINAGPRINRITYTRQLVIDLQTVHLKLAMLRGGYINSQDMTVGEAQSRGKIIHQIVAALVHEIAHLIESALPGCYIARSIPAVNVPLDNRG